MLESKKIQLQWKSYPPAYLIERRFPTCRGLADFTGQGPRQLLRMNPNIDPNISRARTPKGITTKHDPKGSYEI